ncbi:MAG: hypothetical protein Q4C39_07005, partial [Clostridia bacterium]|nr:hypothetical protein [Clostridia bacterium]
ISKFNISKKDGQKNQHNYSGLYINVGILFKIFAPFIGEFYLYKILILFDLSTLFLMGLLFYSLVRKNNKEYADIFMHHSFFNILHNRVSAK